MRQENAQTIDFPESDEDTPPPSPLGTNISTPANPGPDDEEPEDKKPINRDKSTEHGIERSKKRKIAKKDVEEAIKTAKENGNVETKIGKYGTPQ